MRYLKASSRRCFAPGPMFLFAAGLLLCVLTRQAAAFPTGTNRDFQPYAIDTNTSQLLGFYNSKTEIQDFDKVTDETMPKPYIYYIFWGDYWNANPTLPPYYLKLYSNLINSGYLSELYNFNSGGDASTASSFTNGGSKIIAGSVSGSPYIEVESLLNSKSVSGPGSTSSTQTLYVIITPPGTISATTPVHGSVQIPAGSPATRPFGAEVFRVEAPPGQPLDGGPVPYVPVIWVDGGSVPKFGQGLVDALTDAFIGLRYGVVNPVDNPNQVLNWTSNNFDTVITNSNGTQSIIPGDDAGDVGLGFTETLRNGTQVVPYWVEQQESAIIPFGLISDLAGNALTSFYDGATHVMYVGLDAHIHELYQSGGVWHTRDATQIAGAVPVALMIPLTSFYGGNSSIPSQAHVFYWGSDYNVHELYYYGTNDAGWANGSVNVGTNTSADTPDVMRTLSAIFNPVESTFHVFYNSDPEDNVISEVFADSTGWHTRQVAGNANSQSSLFALMSDTEHLFYIDTSGHVEDAAWNLDQWVITDITTASGDTDVPDSLIKVGSPITNTLSAYDDGTATHVFYVGHKDTLVHEITRTDSPAVHAYSIHNVSSLSGNNDFAGAALTSYYDPNTHLGHVSNIEINTIKLNDFHFSATGSGATYKEIWQKFTQLNTGDKTGASQPFHSALMTSIYDTKNKDQDVFFLYNDVAPFGVNYTGDIGLYYNPNNMGWFGDIPTGNTGLQSHGPLAVP